MIGTLEKENITNNESKYDFDLGIVGFKYSDLYDARKLKEIAEKFYAEIEEESRVLHEALMKYIDSRGDGYEKRVESKILTDSAPYLSDFIGRMFKISHEREKSSERNYRARPDLEIQIFRPTPRDQKI